MITKFKLFEQKEENWSLILDISKIWNESLYENCNELLKFNQNYINFFNENKNIIIQQTSEDAWNKLQELINRLNDNKDKLNESVSIWDDIYDWADGNLVEIKTEKELKTDF